MESASPNSPDRGILEEDSETASLDLIAKSTAKQLFELPSTTTPKHGLFFIL